MLGLNLIEVKCQLPPIIDPMKWANALSIRPSLEAAIKEVVDRAQNKLQATAHLGVIFISSSYGSEYPRVMPLIQELLPQTLFIGCSGAGVIGGDDDGDTQEVEGNPALSLSLAHLPDVTIDTFYISGDELPDADSPPNAWIELTGVDPAKNPQFILLSNPISSSINDLIQGLDFAYPGSPKIGGLASTGIGHNSGLFHKFQLYRSGTVGIALSGNIVMETIVAQGCRPIGETFRVTQGERNIILQVTNETERKSKSQPPLQMLRELVQTLTDEDRLLAQNALFIGVAVDEFKEELKPRDFLIRNLLGVDPSRGAIAIGDRVRTGQRSRFYIRDARTSTSDLMNLLQDYQKQKTQDPLDYAQIGVLMFSCLGRGMNLYNKPNFDSSLFHYYTNDDIPVSGFFCNGEIGPINRTTFLHGYTSVFGILRPLIPDHN